MTNQWPRITIVTPSYNQAQFLAATIDSVLVQAYPNLEYIVIDGGSTDGSLDTITRYAPSLAYWRSERDAGHYDAVNNGFARATGEIMGWLNSDDMYFPWTLHTVASIFMACPEIEWLTTLERATCDWHGFCVRYYPMTGYARDAFLDGRYLPASPFGGCIQQESTFWRRSVWEKIGGMINYRDFSLAGDFDLWARFYQHAELYGTFSPLAGFRYRDEQRSQHVDAYLQEANQSLNSMRHALDWSPRPTPRPRFFQRIPALRRCFPTTNTPIYQAKRVVRKQPGSPNASWEIEEYTFA